MVLYAIEHVPSERHERKVTVYARDPQNIVGVHAHYLEKARKKYDHPSEYPPWVRSIGTFSNIERVKGQGILTIAPYAMRDIEPTPTLTSITLTPDFSLELSNAAVAYLRRLQGEMEDQKRGELYKVDCFGADAHICFVPEDVAQKIKTLDMHEVFKEVGSQLESKTAHAGQ